MRITRWQDIRLNKNITCISIYNTNNPKMKLREKLHLNIKIHSRWNIDLNFRAKIIKLLEENIEKILSLH